MRDQVKNLKFIFEPKSIAVIGASRTHSKVGSVLLKNLIEGRFQGKIYPINPKYTSIMSLKCYPSVLEVKEKIDCAIIAIPAKFVPSVLEQCGQKGIKGVVVLSGGFTEVGNVGLEKQLKEIADRYQIAVLGPNCVSGDSSVLISKGEMAKNVKIGSLVNSLMEKYKKFVYCCSGTEVLDLANVSESDQIKTASFCEGKITFKRVSKLFRRKNCSDVFKVSLFGGRKIICSADHPFLVRAAKKGNKLLKVNCKDLKGNELIPCPLDINVPSSSLKIDLFNEIKRMRTEGLLDKNHITNLRFLIEGNSYALNGNSDFVKIRGGKFKDWDSGQYVYWKNGQTLLPREFPLDESLSILSGFFVADGNYHDNYMKIGYVDSPYEESKLRKYADSVFLTPNSRPRSSHSKSKELKFGRKVGNFLFQNIFGIPKYAHNKRAPNFVFSSPTKVIISFLSGLFSGDGGVYFLKKSRKNSLYFFSVSKDLVEDVIYLLHLIGVDAYTFTKNRTKMKFWDKTYPARDLHGLRIDSVHSIKKLHDLGFRFLDPEQNQKLVAIINQDLKGHLSCNRSCCGPISYKKIRELTKLDDEYDLYDFEVEGSHNFVVNNILTSNCLGILNPYQRVDSIFLPMYKLERPRPGGISLITQSGAVGTCVVDLAAHYGVGITKFISYGNGTVINESDILDFLEYDDKTEQILLYIEGVDEGKRLLKTTKRVNKKKPIIVLKSGRGKMSSKAASSHTGNIAGSYLAYKSAFRQAKLVIADSLDELFEFVKIFNQPLPKGDRIGIVTNGGGLGILTTDVVEKKKLNLLDFSKETKEKLKKIIPSYANAQNPLDIIADAGPDLYNSVIKVMLKDEKIDAIIVIVLFQAPAIDERLLNIIINASDKKEKPIIVIAVGGDYTDGHRKILDSYGVPTYQSPSDAVKALRKLVDYAKYRKGV